MKHAIQQVSFKQTDTQDGRCGLLPTSKGTAVKNFDNKTDCNSLDKRIPDLLLSVTRFAACVQFPVNQT